MFRKLKPATGASTVPGACAGGLCQGHSKPHSPHLTAAAEPGVPASSFASGNNSQTFLHHPKEHQENDDRDGPSHLPPSLSLPLLRQPSSFSGIYANFPNRNVNDKWHFILENKKGLHYSSKNSNSTQKLSKIKFKQLDVFLI